MFLNLKRLLFVFTLSCGVFSCGKRTNPPLDSNESAKPKPVTSAPAFDPPRTLLPPSPIELPRVVTMTAPDGRKLRVFISNSPGNEYQPFDHDFELNTQLVQLDGRPVGLWLENTDPNGAAKLIAQWPEISSVRLALETLCTDEVSTALSHLKSSRIFLSIDTRANTSLSIDQCVNKLKNKRLYVELDQMNTQTANGLQLVKNLVGLYIDGSTTTDAHLHKISGNKNLLEFTANRSRITDKSAQFLSTFTKLERLELSYTRLSDKGLSQLSALTELTFLDLSHTRITSSGMNTISSYKNLRTLYLSSSKIKGNSLVHISKLKKLQLLDLSGTLVDSVSMSHLGQLYQLRHLSLQNTNIDDVGLEHLKKLIRLRSLNIHQTMISADASKSISRFKELRILTPNDLLWQKDTTTFDEFRKLRSLSLLTQTDIPLSNSLWTEISRHGQLISLCISSETDIPIESLPISNLAHLRKLDLTGLEQPTHKIHDLSTLKELRYLSLMAPTIEESVVRQIANLTQLRTLRIRAESIDTNTLNSFHQLEQLRSLSLHIVSPLPAPRALRNIPNLQLLQQLDMSDSHLSDNVLVHIVTSTQLRILNLSKNPLTDTGVAQLVTLAPNLESIDLSHTQITDRALEDLARLESLRVLILNGTNITNLGLSALKNSNHLNHIELGQTNVTTASSSLLASMKWLESINLSNTTWNDSALVPLKDLPYLRTLNLKGTMVTDQGLNTLLAMEKLDDININKTSVTKHGVSEFLLRDGPWTTRALDRVFTANFSAESLAKN